MAGASLILIVGLGDPASWTPALSGRAAAMAVRTAAQLGMESAAFAPSILDVGLTHADGRALGEAMVRAVLSEIDGQLRLVEKGVSSALSLRRWVFDVSAPRFEGVAALFQAIVSATGGEGPSV